MILLESNGNNVGPQLEWLFQHIAIIGWPTLCYLAWKSSQWINKATATATKATTQIDKMATEYFPSMRDSLTKQDSFLNSMDESLKTVAERMPSYAVLATASKVKPRRKKAS